MLVILEPTRNAWVALAAWFRRRGARVVLVPPERSSDLRDYYHKHTKSDRLDSRLLARLPLLHPEGLHDEHGLGPGDPLRRATQAAPEPGAAPHEVAGAARCATGAARAEGGWRPSASDLSNKTPLRFLAAGYACPDTVKRLGRARLARFLHRHSRGQWGAEAQAAALLAAAEETLALWEGAFDFGQLAEDIAVEARIALSLGRRHRRARGAHRAPASRRPTPRRSSPRPRASVAVTGRPDPRPPRRSRTASAPSPACAPSAAWSPRSTPPA